MTDVLDYLDDILEGVEKIRRFTYAELKGVRPVCSVPFRRHAERQPPTRQHSASHPLRGIKNPATREAIGRVSL